MILASHFQRMSPEEFDRRWRSQARSRIEKGQPFWTQETPILASDRLSHEQAAREYGKSVFRHEYGHNASNQFAIADFHEMSRSEGKEWIKNNISQYAAKNIMETAAETFSKVTARDYKPGTLPERWEKTVVSMLVGAPSRTSDFAERAVKSPHRHFVKKFGWAKEAWKKFAEEDKALGGQMYKQFTYKGTTNMSVTGGAPEDPGVDDFNPEFEPDWFQTMADPEYDEGTELNEEDVGGFRKTRKTKKVQGLDY
jgi:hypothetical protein